MRSTPLLLSVLLLAACALPAPADTTASRSSSIVADAEMSSSSAAIEAPERFFFRYFDEQGAESEWPTTHGMLIEIDPMTKKENVLWEDANISLLPALQNKGNSLGVYAQLNADTLLLNSIVVRSDATMLHLFTFNVKTKDLQPMQFEKTAHMFFDTAVLSPDNKYLVWIEHQAEGTRTVQVADLEKDTARTIATLDKQSESFYSGCENLGCYSHEMIFTSPRTVEIAVFAYGECGKNGIVCDADNGRPVLRYLKTTINEGGSSSKTLPLVQPGQTSSRPIKDLPLSQ